MRTLKAKSLNLKQAFELAFVLSKYINKEDLDKADSQDALDFIGNIIQKITPDDYLHGVTLLTQTDENTIKKYASIEILTAMIEGLKLNQIVTLVSFYRSLGL